MSVLLEAEHLTKVFLQKGKEPFKAVSDVSFTLASRRNTGNRRRVWLREKYAGKNAYTSDGYQQWNLKIPGKRYHEAETKRVKTYIWEISRWYFRIRQVPLIQEKLWRTELERVCETVE